MVSQTHKATPTDQPTDNIDQPSRPQKPKTKTHPDTDPLPETHNAQTSGPLFFYTTQMYVFYTRSALSEVHVFYVFYVTKSFNPRLRCRLMRDVAQRINGSETDPQDPDPPDPDSTQTTPDCRPIRQCGPVCPKCQKQKCATAFNKRNSQNHLADRCKECQHPTCDVCSKRHQGDRPIPPNVVRYVCTKCKSTKK